MARKSLRKNKRGGNCAVPAKMGSACPTTPDVSGYKNPCTEIGKSNIQGGSCGSSGTDCLGNSTAATGKNLYEHGSPSESAWFHRGTYGAETSTNVVSSQKGGKKPRSRRNKTKSQRKNKKGGNYRLNLNERIGGLAKVDHDHQSYVPSTRNLVVPDAKPGNAHVTNKVSHRGGSKNKRPRRGNKSKSNRRSQRKSPRKPRKSLNFTKRSRSTRRRNLRKRGGANDYPASVSGENSNYSGDMNKRDFNGKQPTWGPDNI